MGLPQKLHIFFVQDNKKDHKQYQIQLLIQHRSKTLAYPLHHVLSGYLAWFSWPMRWESCMSMLLLGPCHILHKRAVSLLRVALKASMLFPQAGPKMLKPVMFWNSCPEAGSMLLAAHRSIPGDTLLVLVWPLLHRAWSNISVSRHICYGIHSFHNCFHNAQFIMSVFYFCFQRFFRGNFQ